MAGEDMTFDVIVCGSLHLDIVVNAPALPRIDETAVGTSWSQICGGKGGNQAVQATRAGARTAMIGRIGADDFGKTLSDNLAEADVDLTCLSTDPDKGSGMSVAILQDNGDYGAVIVSGSNLTIDPGEIARQWQQLGGAKVLVLQNEVPEQVNIAAAKVAAANGAQVILNAAPARALSPEFLDHVHVLIVNRVEAEAMSGLPVHDFATAHLALPSLQGPLRAVVITLGGTGLLATPADGNAVEIAALPVKVTSTHGAGDCFVGVLAARLAAGASLVDGCLAANERAAEYVSR
jgi:ribokinase